MLLGLRALTRAAVQLPEAEVTVGDKRAHAEVGGQYHGLTVAFCRPYVERVPMCRDFCEGPECPGLVAALVVLSGDIQSTSREVGCTSHSTRQEICLAEPRDPERIVDRSSDGAVLLHDLPKEIQAIGATPGMGIRVAEVRGHVGKPHRDVPLATEPERTFERQDGPSKVSLAERHKSDTEARPDQAERVTCRFGDPDPSSAQAVASWNSPRSARLHAIHTRERTEGRPATPKRSRTRSPSSIAAFRLQRSIPAV
jgi:hypothetical protein